MTPPARNRPFAALRVAAACGLSAGLLAIGLHAVAQQPAAANGAPRTAERGAYGDMPRFAVMLRDGSSYAGAIRSIDGGGGGVVVLAVEDSGGVPSDQAALPLESVAFVAPIDDRAIAGVGIGPPPPLGRATRVPTSDVRASALSGQTGVLELVDGQRLTGSIDRSAQPDDETLAWMLPTGGRVLVPLERVARVVDQAARANVVPIPTNAGDEDMLVLLNGDVLTGFLLGLSPAASIETDSGIVDVPADRIAGAVLANPAEPATGAVVALVDGTVVHASSVSTSAGVLTIASQDGWSLTAPIGDVRTFVPSAASITPLASLEPVLVEPLGDRVFATPPGRTRNPVDTSPGSPAAVGVLDIVIEGASRVRYAVPDGAAVLTFGLGPVRAAAGARWADGSVVFTLDGQEIEVPAADVHDGTSLSLELGRAATLTIEVRPGELGGVGAGVTLHRPVFVAGE